MLKVVQSSTSNRETSNVLYKLRSLLAGNPDVIFVVAMVHSLLASVIPLLGDGLDPDWFHTVRICPGTGACDCLRCTVAPAPEAPVPRGPHALARLGLGATRAHSQGGPCPVHVVCERNLQTDEHYDDRGVDALSTCGQNQKIRNYNTDVRGL